MRVPNVNYKESMIRQLIRTACEYRSGATGKIIDHEEVARQVLSHKKYARSTVIDLIAAYMDKALDRDRPDYDPFGVNATS